MTRRAVTATISVLAALLGVLGVALAQPAGATRGAGDPAVVEGEAGHVVLVGTAGLTWSDVTEERTPALWSLVQQGATAAMTTRSVNTNSCPIDGWLGLSAGGRAAAPAADGEPTRDTDEACPQVPQPTPDGTGAVVPGWTAYLGAAHAKRFGSRLGLLAEQAAAGGACVSAVGPGAAVAAADPTGRAARYAEYAPAGLGAALAACPVTIVDVGALRDPADVASGEPVDLGTRAAQVAAIDARIGEVLAASPADADVLVAALADAGRTDRLHLAAGRGPQFPPGSMTSSSTRQPGLVQTSDLTTTVLRLAGLSAPHTLGGAVLGSDGSGADSQDPEAAARDRLQGLIDYDEASHEVHSLVPPFFNGFVYTQLAFYLLVLLVWRRSWGSPEVRRRLLRVVRAVAVVGASVPAATFLANLFPWWRFDPPMLAVVGAVAVFVALIALVALLGPWGRSLFGPAAVVALATMLVLAIDVMTGSRLQLSSLMGLQPVIGGRYYGVGNTTFALFATATLIFCTALSHHLLTHSRRSTDRPDGEAAAAAHLDPARRRVAALAVAAVGLVAVVVDGHPTWGADGGGPPALIPALVYLVLAILGVALTWRRAVTLGLVTAALFVLVAFLDWLRAEESRSHLGRFFQSMIDGGAWDIVVRKGQQNLSILFGNTQLTLLVPIALAFVIYVLARPTSWGSRALQHAFDRAPTLRAGLIAVVIALTIGFAINDSGTAVPAVGATILVPLLVAVSVRTLEDEFAAGRAAQPAR